MADVKNYSTTEDGLHDNSFVVRRVALFFAVIIVSIALYFAAYLADLQIPNSEILPH
ncbi:MAG: hypothetical protein R3E01_04120 [Pirellulaceae bacterium]